MLGNEQPLKLLYADAVKQQSLSLLRTAKSRVKQLSLFSTNELIEDVATTDLQYILLDYYIADTLYSQSTASDTEDIRTNLLKESQDAFNDYLTLLKDYCCLSKEELKHWKNWDAISAADRRLAKIAQFNREKEIQTQLDGLRNDDDDDDVKRQVVMMTATLFVQKSISALRMISDEIKMLGMARQAKLIQQQPTSSTDDSTIEMTQKQRTRLRDLQGPLMDKNGKPLRPFVITSSKRETIANSVFQHGHNLPTMSIDEYLEREFQRGNFLSGGTEEPQKSQPSDENNDAIDAETYKQRQWDEFKEDNPKGWGNRMNKG